MSLSFVVQQTLRLMNPPTSATTSSPSSPTPAAVAGAFALPAQPNDPATPPAVAKDFPGGDVDGLSGGGEAKAWGRLRDYEVEEAQTISHRLLARRQQQQTPMASSGDTFMPDGDLLFTDRYIQRFLEEEERTKRESADWTRNLDSSTARFRADTKERDPTAIPTTTSTSHYDHYTENDEAEGYGDVDYGDSGGDHGGASHHQHVGVRSSLSSVSRALGRKVKFSSSKIAASLGSRRIHRKDKGKEAATGRHHGYHYADADADYYYGAQQQHPLYDVADAGLLPAFVVPSGTALPEAEPLFPLFNAGLAPAAARSSSSSATSTGDFEKTWGRDYSPFSTYAFDQRPAAQQPQQDQVNVFHSDDEGDGNDLPPLEHLNP